jgi:hypothetical protein
MPLRYFAIIDIDIILRYTLLPDIIIAITLLLLISWWYYAIDITDIDYFITPLMTLRWRHYWYWPLPYD